MIIALLLALAAQLPTLAQAQSLGVIDFDMIGGRIFMILEDGSLRYRHSLNDRNVDGVPTEDSPFDPVVTAWLSKNKLRLVTANSINELFLVTQSGEAYVIGEKEFNRIIPVTLAKDFTIKTIVTVTNEGYCALSTNQKVACWNLEGVSLRIPTLISSSRIVSLESSDKGYLSGATQSGVIYQWFLKGLYNYFYRRNGRDLRLRQVPFGVGFHAIQPVVFDLGEACALSRDHEIRCIGEGALVGGYRRRERRFGYVPPYFIGSGRRPILLGEGFRPVQLAGTLESICALSDKGQVKCWGRNDVGNLGQGNLANRGETLEEMGDAVPFLDLGRYLHAVRLKGYNGMYCALLNNKALKCWGQNTSSFHSFQPGSLGDAPGEMGDSLQFIDPDFTPPEKADEDEEEVVHLPE